MAVQQADVERENMILVSGGGKPVTESIKTIRKGGCLNVVSVVLVCIFYCCDANLHGKTYVVFRYDDLSADRPGERENNPDRQSLWEAEQAVDGLFQDFGLPYVIAIVPKGNGVSFAEDAEKIEFIKRAVKAERVEVAQHGFDHTNHTKKGHRPAEFRERDYKSQLQDIKSGKEILCKSGEFLRITTFIPPWNGWDDNTARILKKADFKILSADRHYYPSVKGLTVIPYTTVLEELESMVAQMRLPEEGIIVVVYHPFDIVKYPEDGLDSLYFGIERFEELLKQLSKSPEVKVATFAGLAEERDDLTIERYQQASKLWRQRAFWAKLLPEQLWPGSIKQEIYLTSDEYSKTLWYWRAATVGLAGVLFMMGFLVRYLLNLALSAKWRFRMDVLATLLFCLSIISGLCLLHRGYHMTAIRLIPAFVTVSFVIALLLRVPRIFSDAKRVSSRFDTFN